MLERGQRRRQGAPGEGARYVSCIRLDGEPLLPPLVTDEERQEAERWRLRAQAVERRLAERRLLRQSPPRSCAGSQGSEHPGAGEGRLSPRAASPSPSISLDHSGSRSGGGDVKGAPPRLTACLLDVADFSQGGCTLLHHHGTALRPSDLQANCNDVNAEVEMERQKEEEQEQEQMQEEEEEEAERQEKEEEEEEAAGPARLVRSGSYTLANPSPVLLAHLERQSLRVVQTLETEGSLVQGEAGAVAGAAGRGRRSLPVSVSASASSASGPSTCDDDLLDSVFGHSTDRNDESAWESLAQSWLGCETGVEQEQEEEYKEQEEEEEDQYEDAQMAVAGLGGIGGTGGGGDDDLLRRLRQSQHDLALTAPPGMLAARPLGEAQAPHHNQGEEEQQLLLDGWDARQERQLRLIESLLRGAPAPGPGLAYCRVIELVSAQAPALPAPREPEEEAKAEAEERRRRWAASVIGAAARGYLTRRLMRSERVQGLIQTIHDAVVCAVQLHEVQQLEEADVELHRRLIQQVSAACYAFHDVFFALSAPEQMAIIAADRKRKLERAKRAVIHT